MSSLNFAQCPDRSKSARLPSTGEYTPWHPSARAISSASRSSSRRTTAPAGSHSGSPAPGERVGGEDGEVAVELTVVELVGVVVVGGSVHGILLEARCPEPVPETADRPGAGLRGDSGRVRTGRRRSGPASW